MNAAIQPLDQSRPTYGANRSWEANIELAYAIRREKTRLTSMNFKGPLRVQRPFYPEGECCHTYLLHPPGGMVSGDTIRIHASVASGAKVFVTTPSAGKMYGADASNVQQTQNISLEVGDEACLEFMPQENILFDRANAFLASDISIKSSSKLVFMDVVSFGRPHGGYHFVDGSLKQTLSIRIDGSPVLDEGFKTDPKLRVLKSPVGLAGHLHMGSLIFARPAESSLYDQWVEQIRALLPKPDQHLKIAATHRSGLIIIRGLADDIETLRNHFIRLWQSMREPIIGAQALTPRIWLT